MNREQASSWRTRRIVIAAIYWGACGIWIPNCSSGASPPSGDSSDADEENEGLAVDALQSDGPLRGVSFAGQVEREAPVPQPTLSFTTNDTEVTAVIGLGAIEGNSTLVVTWYRSGGFDEREMLFSHQIAVGAGGLAFSQAVAPAGLAPGIYDTEATLDGHVVHTPWIVRDETGSRTRAKSREDSAQEVWETPSAGDSWWDEFGGDPPPPSDSSSDTCTVDAIYPGTVPLRDVKVHTFWLGPCTTGTITATVSGTPTTVASSDSLNGRFDHAYGQFDVCALSGGSDMPGTVVHFEVQGSAIGTEDFALPDYGELLLADLESLPEAGGRVERGDEIRIHAIALVFPPALGVQTLYVDDGSDLLESVGNRSGSDVPVACDPRRFVAELFTEYVVPADASGVIELCATGVGFDGTVSKNCIHHTVGTSNPTLTGSELRVTETTRDDGGGGFQRITSRQEITFSLAGAEGGRLQGQAQITYSRVIEVFRTFREDCQTTTDTYGPVEWDAVLEGTYSFQSDGSLAVGFTATPPNGPDYPFTSITPGCPESNLSSTETGISWTGGGWNLVNGVYDNREDYELQIDVSGEDFYEIHLNWTDAP